MESKCLTDLVKRNSNDLARIVVVLIFLGLALWALALEFSYGASAWIGSDSELGRFMAATLVSIGPELAGIVIGVVTIDYLNEQRQDEQLRRQLILQMGSQRNDVTDTAIRALMALNWLYDGSLKGALLSQANLEGANLSGANLEQVHLAGANLKGADLSWARLADAHLLSARLEDAYLAGANLKGAHLSGASLAGADLSWANLEGAHNIRAGQLLQVSALKGATMPDGSSYQAWLQRLAADKQVDGATVARLLGPEDGSTPA